MLILNILQQCCNMDHVRVAMSYRYDIRNEVKTGKATNRHFQESATSVDVDDMPELQLIGKHFRKFDDIYDESLKSSREKN